MPPRAGTGSVSWTIAARVSGFSKPTRASPHCPAHDALRSRSAAPPHSAPATSITPTAAPSGARRHSTAAPPNTSSAVTRSSAPWSAAANPAAKAMARYRIGGGTPRHGGKGAGGGRREESGGGGAFKKKKKERK